MWPQSMQLVVRLGVAQCCNGNRVIMLLSMLKEAKEAASRCHARGALVRVTGRAEHYSMISIILQKNAAMSLNSYVMFLCIFA